MSKWTNLNKVRIHNRNETTKHFILKAMVTKLLFNAGYSVHTEDDENWNYNMTQTNRISDVKAHKHKEPTMIVEIETTPSKQHIKDLLKFYEDQNLYIIKTKEMPDDIIEMEKKIKYLLGL